jgi:hypothetical protein
MHQSTGMEIAHGFIQRRLGGKLWQAQLMPPIPAYVQRSEFGCGFSTKNRSLWPTITRAKNFATQHRSPQFRRVWASFARAGPICETLTAIDRYPACTRCLYHRHNMR